MSNIEVEICTNQADLDEAFALRFDVFKKDYDQPAHELVDDVWVNSFNPKNIYDI